jgi:hypothetical protein
VEDLEDDEDEAPRVKPAIPGMDLEVDIVPEGEDALRAEEDDDEDSAGDSGRRTSSPSPSPRRPSTSRRARAIAPRASARPPSRA